MFLFAVKKLSQSNFSNLQKSKICSFFFLVFGGSKIFIFVLSKYSSSKLLVKRNPLHKSLIVIGNRSALTGTRRVCIRRGQKKNTHTHIIIVDPVCRFFEKRKKKRNDFARSLLDTHRLQNASGSHVRTVSIVFPVPIYDKIRCNKRKINRTQV